MNLGGKYSPPVRDVVFLIIVNILAYILLPNILGFFTAGLVHTCLNIKSISLVIDKTMIVKDKVEEGIGEIDEIHKGGGTIGKWKVVGELRVEDGYIIGELEGIYSNKGKKVKLLKEGDIDKEREGYDGEVISVTAEEIVDEDKKFENIVAKYREKAKGLSSNIREQIEDILDYILANLSNVYLIQENPYIIGYGSRDIILVDRDLILLFLQDDSIAGFIALFHEAGHALGFSHTYLRGWGRKARARGEAITPEEGSLAVGKGLQDTLFGVDNLILTMELEKKRLLKITRGVILLNKDLKGQLRKEAISECMDILRLYAVELGVEVFKGLIIRGVDSRRLIIIAIKSLADLHADEAIGLLLQLYEEIDDDKELIQIVEEAIIKIGSDRKGSDKTSIRRVQGLFNKWRGSYGPIQDRYMGIIDRINNKNLIDLRMKKNEPFFNSLKSPDKNIRILMLDIFDDIGDPIVIPSLLDILENDEDYIVRGRAAAVLLGMINKYPWHEDNLKKRLKVNNTKNILKAYILIEMQKWAEIVNLGSDAVPALIKSLFSPIIKIQRYSAEALGKIGDMSATITLGMFLIDRHKDPFARTRAAEALAKIGDRKAITFLKIASTDEDVEVGSEVIKSIGEIGDNREIGILAEFLNDKDNYVRGSAAGGLLNILRKYPKYEKIVEKAYGAANIKLLLTAYILVAEDKWDSVVELGSYAIPALEKASKDPNILIRRYTKKALDKISIPSALWASVMR